MPQTQSPAFPAADQVFVSGTPSHYTPAAPYAQDHLEAIDAALATFADDQTADEVPFTPAGSLAATNVQDAIEELDSELPARLTDALTETIQDGYGIAWVVEEDSLGTHLYPDRIVDLATDTYASDITIDLDRTVGELHRFTLEGNPTLTVTNFAHDPTGTPRPGKQFMLNPVQDATGGRSIDFEGSSQTWLFPDGEPALTSIPGGEDFLVFRVEDVSPATFRFVRALHRPRKIELTSTHGNAVTFSAAVHWPFEESSGTTRLDDIGGHQLRDDASEVGTTTGQFASAAAWSSGANSLRADHDVALQPRSVDEYDFSVSVWFRLGENSSVLEIEKQSESGAQSWALYSSSGQIVFEVRKRTGGTTASVTSAATLTADSQWHLIVAVCDAVNKTVKISIDGSAFATTVQGVDIGYAATSGELFVGVVSSLESRLDDLTLYHEALSDSKKNDLWNSGTGVEIVAGSSPSLDWLRELNYVTLEAGSGTYSIDIGDVQPSQTIRVAIANDGASGDLEFTGTPTITWPAGRPPMPADGQTMWVDLFAESVASVIGWQVLSDPPGFLGEFVAGEAITANALVNFDATTGEVYLADREDSRPAHGFAPRAATLGDSVSVYDSGTFRGLSAMTLGKAQFLTTAGQWDESAPETAGLLQQIGRANSTTSLRLQLATAYEVP